MFKMKYIIVDSQYIDEPYIFPDHINHSDFARLFDPQKVISAGFVLSSTNGITCYGRSESLNIGSRSEDTDIINKMLGVDRQ